MGDMIERIVDECIDRIVIYGDSVEECLARYPERQEELEPLLRAAAATAEGYRTGPRAEFQRAAKSRFMNAVAAAREESGRSRSWYRAWGRGWVVTALVVLALLIVGSGTVGASTKSLPGDLLYPVKRAAENVQAFFTFGREAKANLYVKFAERRINELRMVAAEGEEAPAAVLARMDDQTRKALRLASENGSFSPAVAGRLLALTVSEGTVLREMSETAPPRARKALREALVKSEMAHEEALVIWSGTQGHRGAVDDRGSEGEEQGGGPLTSTEPTATPSADSTADSGGRDQRTPGPGHGASDASPSPQDGGTVGDVEAEPKETESAGHYGPRSDVSPSGQQQGSTDGPPEQDDRVPQVDGREQPAGTGAMPCVSPSRL